MRTISDFDRPYPGTIKCLMSLSTAHSQVTGESALYNLVFAPQDGDDIAVANIYKAGIKIVQGILYGWKSEFEKGIKPTNYIGDAFESLGGKADFG